MCLSGIRIKRFTAVARILAFDIAAYNRRNLHGAQNGNGSYKPQFSIALAVTHHRQVQSVAIDSLASEVACPIWLALAI